MYMNARWKEMEYQSELKVCNGQGSEANWLLTEWCRAGANSGRANNGAIQQLHASFSPGAVVDFLLRSTPALPAAPGLAPPLADGGAVCGSFLAITIKYLFSVKPKKQKQLTYLLR